MEEIFQIADRYSVLRNGKTVGAGMMSEINEKDLVNLMIEKVSVFNHTRKSQATEEAAKMEVHLQVEDLKTDVLKGISLTVREGELLGIGGLMGQGQRDLLLALFGDIPHTGRIKIKEKSVHFRHPKDAIKNDIALVPGDRAREGLLYIRSILENMLLPSWREYGFPLKIRAAQKDATQVSSSLSLKMSGLDAPVSSLSGGNAQKVVIGKWLKRKPQLMLLDDPTKGVDVGTKAEFYNLLTTLCEEGKTIIFYSSDDEELIGLCDRVLVMHDGIIRTELRGESLNKQNLIAASLGSVNGSKL
jgi:ribose transport system ATP-binding protein